MPVISRSVCVLDDQSAVVKEGGNLQTGRHIVVEPASPAVLPIYVPLITGSWPRLTVLPDGDLDCRGLLDVADFPVLNADLPVAWLIYGWRVVEPASPAVLPIYVPLIAGSWPRLTVLPDGDLDCRGLLDVADFPVAWLIYGWSQSTTVGFKVLPKSSEEPSDPVAVYKSTLAILKALSGLLLSLKTEGKNGDENTTLMAMLGEHIWPELSKCIITHCLVHSIPTSSSKLNEYKAVITATERFEASLRKTGQFIAETASLLLTYARDVNVHFANKKCQELIVEARKLMKRELHNTKRVGTMKVDNKNVKDQKQDAKDKCHVSESIFALPECAVSESIECLVNLAYQTLQEAASNTPQCAIQLFYTVRNMFEIFCDVVPTYHRDSLQKLPLECALHHNNCMYIAHHLLTLGHQYRQSLPPPLCDGTYTFVDLIPVFRKLASECFLAQMKMMLTQLSPT
ncbi:centromere/kinetochore protein zw10 homolog [Patiria miniata]|uniref:Uncharacterized protein n=1 Tax=Patiria miniata TaxID=46514 RepID=A0A914BU70_PATMI|nr:centromere/kinetochore protein zw10 homolog [Patiria miniata]